MDQALGEKRRVATDSHRSLERWDLEAGRCQNPCG